MFEKLLFFGNLFIFYLDVKFYGRKGKAKDKYSLLDLFHFFINQFRKRSKKGRSKEILVIE